MIHFLLAMIEDLLVPSARNLHVHRCTRLTYLPVHFDAVHVYIRNRLGYPSYQKDPLLDIYYSFTCPYMHPFMTVPVHFHTSFRLAAKIYPSTFLLLYMSTDISVDQFACSV